MLLNFALLFGKLFRIRTDKRIVLLAVLSSVLAACQGPNGSYLSNGIGSELAYSDGAAATKLQTQYFRLLCEQAGYSGCVLPLSDRAVWTMIVRQGMNDIDRRCDGYLEWLDDRKRSKAPFLSEVNDLRGATASVLAIVSPGSKAISLVGYAFGLLTESVENYHSRLLLEVESSTINSIVLRARHDFRENTAGTRYESRPEAEYALRSYLRLCLPFAIETNINDYSTLGSRGIPVDEDNTINQTPVGSRQVIGDSAAGPERGFNSGSREKGGDTTIKNPITGAITPWEKQLQPSDLTMIQDYLCVEASNAFGPKTRAGILMLALKKGQPSADNLLDQKEGGKLLSDARQQGACAKSKFSNVFERLVFVTPADETSFYKDLVAALGENDAVTGNETLVEARPLLVRYYEKNKNYIMEGVSTSEVTPRMYKRIISQRVVQ